MVPCVVVVGVWWWFKEDRQADRTQRTRRRGVLETEIKIPIYF